MTRAAKHFGKRLDVFLKTDATIEYMAALALALRALPTERCKEGDPSTAEVVQAWFDHEGHIRPDRLSRTQKADIKKSLTTTRQGSRSGTYCHPKLAVFFARWLDVRFAVWCDLMIDNILKGHLQVEVAVPTQEAIQGRKGRYSLSTSVSQTLMAPAF